MNVFFEAARCCTTLRCFRPSNASVEDCGGCGEGCFGCAKGFGCEGDCVGFVVYFVEFRVFARAFFDVGVALRHDRGVGAVH